MSERISSLKDLTVEIEIKSSTADSKMLGIIQSSLEEALVDTIQSVRVVRTNVTYVVAKSFPDKTLTTIILKFASFT